MGYQIQYPVANKLEEKCKIKKRPSKHFIATTICIIFLMVSVYLVGAEGLLEYVIPGDNAVTVFAFDKLQSNLKDGMTIKDSLTEFCQMIIKSANLQ